MKKFNNVTTVVVSLIFIFSLTSQLQTFGQTWLSPNDLNPPTNLTATVVDDNDVNLFWIQPSIVDSTYLHWDNGENYTTFGNFIQPVEMDYAAKWDPNHISVYDGWIITEMRFYVSTPMPTINLKIWTGPDATEIYTQELSDWNVNDWTEVTLDNPVTIDASTQLWAGLNIDMPVTGAVMGCSEGPAISGYGDNYRFNGNWLLGNLNWNIQIKIEAPATRSINSFLGYNVYRDEVQINEDTVTSTSYLDENLLNGTYGYYVTALYDEGESVPSDTIEVLIAQPGILFADSMALVDLYNECNGSGWSINYQWLQGPVNEWAGITTTDTRVTRIHLQSNGLSGDIPESIVNLTALESLHIESNNINSIPDNIGDLVSLEEFWIGWNPIVYIPTSIGDLINLEQLHIGSMELPLDTLPYTFGNLDSLNWLALGGAGLNSLPENFGDLISLENCFIWGNNLTELPEGFGGCESMVYLTIDDNQLTHLPESFGDMSNLETLYLESNQLTSLPVSFGNLNSLFNLRIANNLLTSLPDNFGDLDNLSYLYAYSNQLSSLPESFGTLESLDSLYLFFNQLTTLPDNFGDLSDLNLVALENNIISTLPASFGNLATVEEIYLTGNQLDSLPENFGNMPELITLVLSQNLLNSLPESLCDLPSLEYLYAHQNQIKYISENIGNLSTLKNIAMDQNSIPEIPESIVDITGLEVISLNHNNINTVPETLGELENLVVVAVGDNNISRLPSSMFNNEYDYLWVQENALQFGSLESFVGNVYEFTYYDQAMIGVDTIIDVPYNQTISYTIEVSGNDNIYKWYKDEVFMPNQNTNTLLIEHASNADIGVYVLKVTNTSITDLELVSYNFTISDITSIDNPVITDFTLYPNPVTGNMVNVSISNPEMAESILIINGSGQLVKSERFIENNNSISLNNLSTGMYIVKVIYKDGQYQTEKLLLK